MTWLYGVVGLALGLALGWLMCAFVTRGIADENDELREGIRYVRASIAMIPGYRGIVAYIDRLLGDEAA